MIAFAGMLVPAAKLAGIKVPSDPENYEPMDFLHWHVYCNMQLGASIPSAGDHWYNAEVIAKIPDDKIMEVTYHDIRRFGFRG